MLDRLHAAVADDHVRLAGEDRANEIDDRASSILVVTIGVHDHIRAELETRIEARLERGRETLAARQAHDVVDAVLTGDADGVVVGPVVDDQPLDSVEAVQCAWQLGKRRGKLLGLVEARNLDDQLHLLAA